MQRLRLSRLGILFVAIYNCGQGGYNSRAESQQRSNYYDLMLPEETNRYLFRILAFKYLMENAEQFGFVLEDDEAYPVIKTRKVTVSNSIANLAQFAIDNGTDYKTMQLLNPWLRARTLTVKPVRATRYNCRNNTNVASI